MGHTTLVKCKASIEEFGLEMVKQILEAKDGWRIWDKPGQWMDGYGKLHPSAKQIIVPEPKKFYWGGKLTPEQAKELGISDPENWRTISVNPGDEMKEVKQGEGGAYEKVVGRELAITGSTMNAGNMEEVKAKIESAIKTAKGIVKVRALNRELATMGGTQINEQAAADAMLKALRSKQKVVIPVRSKQQQSLGT